MKTGEDLFNEDISSGTNPTYWIDSTPRKSTSPLAQNLHADVVIIGGGLAGVSTAYCLTKAGKKIVLVEDGFIASGETGRTTAHLVSALDDRYADLEKLFGEEDTRLIADSHKAAIDFIEQTVQKENIQCHFERLPGYLFLHPSDEVKTLDGELEAATKAGVPVRRVESIPGVKDLPGPCLEFPNQAQFHPLLYINALCDAIERSGGQIFTQTHAREINHEGITTSDGFTVKANHVVVATNSPVNNLVAMHLKQTQHRTYVVAGLVKKGAVPKALWWDTGDYKMDKDFPPYHYVRCHPYNDEYDLLISGGEDHATGDIDNNGIQEGRRHEKLEAWTKKHFPLENILYRWSGQVIEPVDSIAFIGRNPLDKENVYIITGDSGTGMTHCTIGGLLITDLILGKQNPWEEIYRPSRISVRAGDVFFKELMRGLQGLLKGAPEDDRVRDLREVAEGEGKIVRIDGNKCGVYRDEDGEYHIVSARCTHLKAILTWNEAEKTWDCPWHGSRFTCDGEVINGPAIGNLPMYKLSKENSSHEENIEEIK